MKFHDICLKSIFSLFEMIKWQKIRRKCFFKSFDEQNINITTAVLCCENSKAAKKLKTKNKVRVDLITRVTKKKEGQGTQQRCPVVLGLLVRLCKTRFG